VKKLAIVLCLAVTFAVPVLAQDPCSQTTKLNANGSGAQSWNGTKSATQLGGSGDDAYGVEAWAEAGGGQTKLTWFGPNQGGGFAFRAEWTNSEDYLGRFGYQWGNNGKKWNALGDLCVDYNYTRSANGTGGSYSYIGVYGWTIGSNNSAEYYIVEDWFGNGQQQASNLGNNCQTHGNITVDGRTYQVVTCIRPQGSGCVGCNNQAFGQVFSIRQNMGSGSKCGTISIKKHFEQWTNMKTEKSGQSPAKYIYDKTYESKFLAEAQAGTGWFEASYMKFSRSGCGGSSGGGTSSSSRASSSSAAKPQATTCKTPLITYPVPNNGVPSDPYTACFKYTNNKCYVCMVSSEGEYEGNTNTCASAWVWDGTQIASNLTSGYWYYEVTCPATSSSSVAASSSSRASSSSAAASSSSRASSSSAAVSSSSRASSSSAVASSSSIVSSSSAVSSSSTASTTSSSSGTAEVSSSSEGEDVTPILSNRSPVTYFAIQTQSDRALRIEISSPAVVEIFDLKGKKVEKFNISSTSQTVKLSSPNGVYFAKVQGMKSIKFVLK